MQRYLILFMFFALVACKTQKVYVPPVQVAVQKPFKDSINEKKPVQIETRHIFSLTLLLSLNVHQYLEKDSVGNYIIPEMDPLNLAALEFYEGMQLARENSDSLIRIRIIDATSDSLKLLKLLKDSLISNSDLVVSVVNPSYNSAVQKMSAVRNFPLLFPINQSNSVMNGNGNTWIANPSNKTQCRKMAMYLKNKYPFATFSIVYRSEVRKEADLADLFNEELHMLFNDTVHRKISYSTQGWDGLQKILDPKQRNIVIAPSSDQAFLSTLLIKLDKEEEYNFIIAGLPTWDHFESIDLSLFERLNTCIFNANFIDFDNEKVKQFRKIFIEKYHTDPLYPAYTGYDIYKWITENVSKFGNAMEKYKSVTSLTAPGSGFIFERSCDSCSYENQYISVLYFKEGTLRIAN